MVESSWGNPSLAQENKLNTTQKIVYGIVWEGEERKKEVVLKDVWKGASEKERKQESKKEHEVKIKL